MPDLGAFRKADFNTQLADVKVTQSKTQNLIYKMTGTQA